MSIGRVLILQPKLVIADESVSMLDVSVRIGILDLLLTMREKYDISFIYITHDLITARYICDRIAIIVKGRILLIDTPDHMKATIQDVPMIQVTFNSPVKSLNLKESGIPRESRVDDTQLRIETTDVLATLQAITTLATRHNLRITNVKMTQPSLEDAFVHLTGVESKIMVLEKEERRQS